MEKKLSLIPKLSRREFFTVGATSFVGFHLLPMAAPLKVQAEEKVSPRGTAECCIFLFLMGGPPQLDTFDLKEGKWTPPDFDVRTMNQDVKMPYALFPKLSNKLNQLLLARSVEAWEGAHERGQYYIQVGHIYSAARASEIPSVGSVVAYEFESRRKASDFLPPYVAMNFGTNGAGLIGQGMLASSCAPLPLTVNANADIPFVVSGSERERFLRRWDFLQRMDRAMRKGNAEMGKPVDDFHNYFLAAHEMMDQPKIEKLLRFTDEEHKRYGASGLGDACILARNLVAADAGTRFIAIGHDGWDLHSNIYDKTKKVNHYTLCRELDDSYAGLLDDLAGTKDASGRSLLDKTLIVCMGEFGRTPGDINPLKGRDHHRYASTSVFSGGGIQGGRVIGATDEQGGKVTKPGWSRKRSIYTEDVVSSIYSALGIDWTKKITNTPSGRAFDYVEVVSGTDYLFPGEVPELFI